MFAVAAGYGVEIRFIEVQGLRPRYAEGVRKFRTAMVCFVLRFLFVTSAVQFEPI